MKTRDSIYSALFFGCCLATITACTENEDITPGKKTPVGITAALTGEVVTKAEKAYAPDTDTKIYLYYKNGANTTETEKAIYTYSSGKWNTADVSMHSTDCIFWDDLAQVEGSYPFFAISPVDVPTTEVQTNQSTEANLIKSDLLMAYTANTALKSNVNLVFKHMLTKLTVKVDMKDVASGSTIAVAAVINNAVKDYTVNYTEPAPTADIPATVTIGTSRTNITPQTVKGTGNVVREFSAILPVQDIQKGKAVVKITITQGDTNYTYTYQPEPDDALSLKQGKETTLTLTVKGTVVLPGTIQVTDWTPTTANGDISIDTP